MANPRGPLSRYAPQTCRVCAHPHRDEIEELIYNDCEYHIILDMFEGFSERTLKTHAAEHMKPPRSELHSLVSREREDATELIKHREIPSDVVNYNLGNLTLASERLMLLIQHTGSVRAIEALANVARVMLEHEKHRRESTPEEPATVIISVSKAEPTEENAER